MAENVLKPVWMTVKLGEYKNGRCLLGALLDFGFSSGSWIERLLSSSDFPISQNVVDLVELSVGSDLGFKEGAVWSKVLERIVELGYGICPAEVGPVLRMKHDKQSTNEFRWIAMQPIKCGNYFHVFCVYHYGCDFWLSTCDYIDSEVFTYGSYVVVAVRPSKASLTA